LKTKPIDCFDQEGKFYGLNLGSVLIIGNGLVMSEIGFEIDEIQKKKEFPSKVSVHRGIIYIYNNSVVYKLCLSCFDLIKVNKCNNINLVKFGIVGTKYGSIIVNDILIKVSDHSICDIQINDEIIYILDLNSCLFRSNIKISDLK
jgi:hypothetical protein